MSGVTERRLSGEGGFSLVELSVTVAVMGILVAIAVPSMLGIMPRVRLDNNVSTLASEISLIRGRAISKGTKFRIVFSPVDDSYALWRKSATECAGTGFWCQIATSTMSGTDLVNVTNFTGADPNALVAEYDGSLNIFFGEQGKVTMQTPPNPPAAVGDYLKRVVVEPMGRVTVERSSDGGSHWVAE